jgi:hypothetical protein
MATFHGRPSILAIIVSAAYAEVAQLENFSGFGFTRAPVAADGYKSTTLGQKFDSAIGLKAGTLRLRFDPTLNTHDDTDGIVNFMLTQGVTSIELRGPSYSAPSTDVVNMSGQFTDWTYLTPKDDIVRGEAQFTPDGSHLAIDGAIKITQTI